MGVVGHHNTAEQDGHDTCRVTENIVRQVEWARIAMIPVELQKTQVETGGVGHCNTAKQDGHDTCRVTENIVRQVQQDSKQDDHYTCGFYSGQRLRQVNWDTV